MAFEWSALALAEKCYSGAASVRMTALPDFMLRHPEMTACLPPATGELPCDMARSPSAALSESPGHGG